MKLLVDMNLSPEWVRVLEEGGWEATHWSKIGDAGASDSEIMTWAKANGYVVFTHDLVVSPVINSLRYLSTSPNFTLGHVAFMPSPDE